LKKASIFFISLISINFIVLFSIFVGGTVGTSSYGEFRVNISNYKVNGTSYGQDFSENPVLSTSNISSGNYGKSGWVVGLSGANLVSTQPELAAEYVDTINETIDENTTKVVQHKYSYYKWSVMSDLYIRTKADVIMKPGSVQKVKVWDYDYYYYGWSDITWENPISTFGLRNQEHYEEYMTYQPWEIYAAASELDFDITILAEITPFTFGAGYETSDGFAFNNSWAGMLSVQVTDFKAGLVPNDDPYVDPKVETDTSDGAPNYSPQDTPDELAESLHSTSDDVESWQYKTADPSETVVYDADLTEQLVGHYESRDTISVVMREATSSTLVKPLIFSQDLELTKAPSSVEIDIHQTLRPQLTVYNNRLTYNYYKLEHKDYDGHDVYWPLPYNPTNGYGDLTELKMTGPTQKSITYPRSAVVKNSYVKYTIKFDYVQIYDFSKSQIVRVGENDTIVPLIPESPLNDSTTLVDSFYQDLSGGNETFIDHPPPTITAESVLDPQESPLSGVEQAWQGYLAFLQTPSGILTTIASIIIIAVVIYLILKIIISIYLPKPISR